MARILRAGRDRVWRALADPAEIAAWDATHGNGGVLDASAPYPEPGTAVRWRYRLGGVPTVMQDLPVEVVPSEKLRAVLTLGPLRLEQTWSLLADPAPGAPDAPRTRLALKIAASNAVAVVGGVIDRFEMRRLVTERVGGSLDAVQAWCERDPG